MGVLTHQRVILPTGILSSDVARWAGSTRIVVCVSAGRHSLVTAVRRWRRPRLASVGVANGPGTVLIGMTERLGSIGMGLGLLGRKVAEARPGTTALGHSAGTGRIRGSGAGWRAQVKPSATAASGGSDGCQGGDVAAWPRRLNSDRWPDRAGNGPHREAAGGEIERCGSAAHHPRGRRGAVRGRPGYRVSRRGIGAGDGCYRVRRMPGGRRCCDAKRRHGR